MRLLPKLIWRDWRAAQGVRSLLIGYSDSARSNWPCWPRPAPAASPARCSAISQRRAERLCRQRIHRRHLHAAARPAHRRPPAAGQRRRHFLGRQPQRALQPGRTPYLPDIKGGLLFLEDVGEQPYRIERMLQQLHLAGVLAKQKAIFLGDFSMQRHVDVYDPHYNFDAVVAELRRISGVPVFTACPLATSPPRPRCRWASRPLPGGGRRRDAAIPRLPDGGRLHHPDPGADGRASGLKIMPDA
ncbi:Murein tetrapeptide carboxypeptidase [Chromobacterium violaceum]|uniref:Murein tetrapeptide carboxypeptidase n=1 Tax=Chromobacterium violaceum TaxID=536 RepID=A0A447TD89_CHRVL|nr:Murein tetrapeptide carboxypeptidase [Chromobacterium violaceum]